jgi:dGTPase
MIPSIKPFPSCGQLAPYAVAPNLSRGRFIAEEESRHRTPHQRDRDRIIHSTAFRRLQYKTQVFVYHEGDYYRTRLTHSLEVAQLTRALARTLALNEDLAEAVALAHDLGHTPFAHAGEEELNLLMQPYGGFNHNDQALRVLTQLERRYAAFDGLNLTWETLEGVAKHNGPWRAALTPSLKAITTKWDLWLESWPSAEAQLAALCDDIAYITHDIDDALRSGLVELKDFRSVPLIGFYLKEVEENFTNLDPIRLSYEAIRRVIDHMVNALLTHSQARLTRLAPQHADDIRQAGEAVIAFEPLFWEQEVFPLKNFLLERVYRHWRVNRMRHKIRRVVRELFELFQTHPTTLPADWQQLYNNQEHSSDKARIVADYIAGMTDRFALEEHHRLFDPFAKT